MRRLQGKVQTGIWLVLVVIIFLFTFDSSAATKDDLVVIGVNRTIKSEVLQEKRLIQVSLPRSYTISTERYPVLYVLDGNWHFTYFAGVVKFLAGQNLIPEMIVVGIANVDRNRDFTPIEEEKRKASGGAATFLRFIRSELFPMIEKDYRTQPFRVLFGHSLGGMLANYILLTAPDMFQAYISASPWLIYADGYVLNNEESWMEKVKLDNKFLYMTIGNEPEILPAAEKFRDIIESAAIPGMQVDLQIMAKESHGSITLLSLYQGLEWIYYGWWLSEEDLAQGMSGIEKHFQVLSGRYGYRVKPPEMTVNLAGYNMLFKENYEAAIALFKLNVLNYPDSANVYDSLGEAYEKSNQLTLAEENYMKANILGKKQKSEFSDTFKTNLKRIQVKLKETAH